MEDSLPQLGVLRHDWGLSSGDSEVRVFRFFISAGDNMRCCRWERAFGGLVRSVDRCEERTHAGEKPDTCDGEPYD